MTNLEITNAYVGDTQVEKIYLGTDNVWPTTPPEPVFSAMPLTFEIINGGTIVWFTRSNPKVIEYSKDNGVTWTSITSSTATSITVETGDKVQFRGYNDAYGGGSDATCSSFIGSGANESTAVFEVYGNIMSLVDGDNYEGLQFSTANTYCFRGLFNHFGLGLSQSTVFAEHLILPDNVVDSCYRAMFARCRITAAAPVLPATTLAENCYRFMFAECTSLVTAPELPATTLVRYCYQQMFVECTSLVTAPELPATTLVGYCYQQMFWGCTSLNYIKCLATNISASTCTRDWVSGVAPIGTFVKHPNATWTTGVNGIPAGWTVEDADI